jgi:Type IV secretion-system coupling protein DNA-binding domain
VSALSPLQQYLLNPAATTHAFIERLREVVLTSLPLLIAAVVASLLVAAGWRLVKCWQQTRLTRDGRFVNILAPPDSDPSGADVLWSNLVALLRPWRQRTLFGQPHLSFEYRWSAAGLGIGVWVPRCVPPGLVERAAESAWPGCRTATSDPAPPLPPDAPATGGTLRLAQPEWFPIETKYEVDPLRALLGGAGHVDYAEHAALQVLARPVTGRRLARCYRAADSLRSGRSAGIVARALDLLSPRTRPVSRNIIDISAAQDIRLVLNKAASPMYEVLVRYAVSSAAAGDHGRRVLRGRAHGMASAFAVFTGRNRFARRSLRRPAEVMAQRHMGRGDLLSVPELAVIAHLPTDPTVPGLARAGARSSPPPPRVATVGKLLGDSDAGVRRPVALGVEDSRYHVHVMGATGTGKSTLLTNLIFGDVAAGRGVVAIDPKGDLISDILDRLPATAADRVVLLDPDERSATPALNVLQGDDVDLVVDNVVGVFRRIFENFWGPRTDDVLRAACLTLLHRGQKATLDEVPELLTDGDARRARIAGLDDPILNGFWAWYEAMSEAQQSQLIGPLMNKLRAFLLRDFVRRVVGSAQSSFEMADVLNGGICLVRVPKGVLGEETARLLGSFVVAAVWQAVTARARSGEKARVDAALYVDECQNFLTLPRSLDEMLAEARGYRLSLVLAHQHLGQLPHGLREAISTNARSKLFFAMSPEDARSMERHVAPELSAHDLSHLGAYQVAARLIVEGEDQPAFTLRTRPALDAQPGRAALVRLAARRHAGTTAPRDERAAVEQRMSGPRVPGA